MAGKAQLLPFGKVTEWTNPDATPDQIRRAKERADWAAMMRASAEAADSLGGQTQRMQTDPAYADFAAEALGLMLEQQRAASPQLLPPVTKPEDLGAFGQGGDDEVVHTNPAERAMLKQMGGAGTRNPITGLLEYRPYGDSGKQQGYSNAADHAARSGGLGGGGGSGGGAQKPDERLYKDPDLGGLTTSWGSPVHTVMEGPNKGVQTAQSEKTWSNTKDQVDKHNKAVREWNNDLVQNNLIGWALPFGFGNVAPRYDQPATYSGGTYHFGMNPAAAVGGVAGMFAGPFGAAVGPAAGAAYRAFGGKDIVFSGPDVPAGWRGGIDPTGGGGGLGGTTGGNPSGGSTGNGGSIGGGSLLPPIAGNPVATTGGNPAPGTTLPPVRTPTVYPGAYRPIPGPSPYGWTRPQWSV